MILKIGEIIKTFEEKYKIDTEEMLVKYNKYFEFFKDHCYISMILDPRIKDRLLKPEDKNKVYIIIKNIYDTYKNKPDEKKINENTFFSSLFPTQIDIDNEIDNYLRATVLGEKSDVLSFWNANKNYFPTLSKMARDYLSIPATSVSCEEMFSEAGDIITKKRNNLSSKLIEEIMCLDSWITDE